MNITFKFFGLIAEIPSAWSISESPDCITFAPRSKFGALQVSSAWKRTGSVSKDDLLEFAKKRTNDASILRSSDGGTLLGIHASRWIGSRYWKEWWLRNESQMIYITFTHEGNRDYKLEEQAEAVVKSIMPLI